MSDTPKPPPSTSTLKPLLWVAVGIVGTVLAMFAINGVPQGLKDALETQAQKEQRLAEVQRQADEALLQSGQWRDPATNLIWTRCSLGQTWNGSDCNGEAKTFNWWDAHQAALNHSEGGHSDWRLPTAPELASLMAGKVQQGKAAYLLYNKANGEEWWSKLLSAAQQKDHQQNYFYSGQKGYVSPKLEKLSADIFGEYWASSPSVDDSGNAWNVSFSNGLVFNLNRNFTYHVRLVRTSQSLEGGNAALLAFEQQAKNIYQDPAYLKWQEAKRQEEARQAAERARQQQAYQAANNAYANRWVYQDHYACATSGDVTTCMVRCSNGAGSTREFRMTAFRTSAGHWSGPSTGLLGSMVAVFQNTCSKQ